MIVPPVRAGAAEDGGHAMAVRGYVLIEAEVGKAKAVGEAVRAVEHRDAGSSPSIRSPALRRHRSARSRGPGQARQRHHRWNQRVEGVQRTTTCLAVQLGCEFKVSIRRRASIGAIATNCLTFAAETHLLQSAGTPSG